LQKFSAIPERLAETEFVNKLPYISIPSRKDVIAALFELAVAFGGTRLSSPPTGSFKDRHVTAALQYLPRGNHTREAASDNGDFGNAHDSIDIYV